MGVWYHQLGRGLGSAVVDDTPWVARGHSRETTYQENLTTPAQVEEAVRVLAAQAFEDTVKDGRPVFRVTLKVRYAPFFTQTRARKLPAPTTDVDAVVAAAVELAGRLDPEREVRLLGVRAEMVMPEEGDPVERTPIRGRL
jgi:DNA polymerase-4